MKHPLCLSLFLGVIFKISFAQNKPILKPDPFALIDSVVNICNIVSFSGSCTIGDVRGKVSIDFSYFERKSPMVIVTYSIPGSRRYTERGLLKNFKYLNDGHDNTKRLTAKWQNLDAGSGDFELSFFGPDKPNTLYIGINGSSWTYFINKDLDQLKYKRLHKILATNNKPSKPIEKLIDTKDAIFKKYPSGPLGQDRIVEIDKGSDEHALGQLEYGISRGYLRTNKITFASNYEIFCYGAGMGCSQGVMIDLRDGRVYSLPIDCPACIDGKEEYYDFKINSFLFTNTICDEKGEQTKYFLWSEIKKVFEEIK